MDRISVVIPLYNTSAYICDAIDSVILQKCTWQGDMEIIVVDDCSTDNSVEVVKRHLLHTYDVTAWLEGKRPDGKRTDEKKSDKKKSDETGEVCLRLSCELCVDCGCHSENKNNEHQTVSFLLYTLPKNAGVAAARNQGVALAQGEYVAFLDADDMWEQGKLARQLRIMQKTDAVLCCTARRLIRADGGDTGKVIPTPRKITLRKLEHSNYISCSSVLAKRSVLEEFPMEHSDAHEDYLTWLRILKEYDYAVGIDEPLLRYRLSETGKSRNKLKSAYMTYKTYRLAGYSLLKAMRLMLFYTVNGIRKYST